MLTQVRRDANNAYIRIFDHKAFVSGEIERTLNNFETQRNDSEVESLLKVAQTVAELKFELSDKCINLSNSHISTISKTLNDCLSEVEGFVSEKNQQVLLKESLTEARKKREEQKRVFCDELDYKYNCVRNTFEEKEEEIAEIYTDLQRKLNIQK